MTSIATCHSSSNIGRDIKLNTIIPQSIDAVDVSNANANANANVTVYSK
jgi:hypothetical protein